MTAHLSALPPNPSDGRTNLQKRRHYNQHSWRKPAIYTFLSGRKKEREREREESFNKKQRLEKEERKEFSITITLFRPRLFGPVLLLSSFSLLSEDHKAAKILDSRFSSETSDGSLSVGAFGGDSLSDSGGRRSVGQLVCPSFGEDELLISLPCNYTQTSRPQKGRISRFRTRWKEVPSNPHCLRKCFFSCRFVFILCS